MSQPKLLIDVLRRELKLAGFEQKADTWYSEKEDVIQIVNVQKSNYGRKYYINIALWLKARGRLPAGKTQEYLWHVRSRWEQIIPRADCNRLERLLDLEDTSIDDENRAAEISRYVRDFILPFFERTKSLGALRDQYQSTVSPSERHLIRFEDGGYLALVVKAQELLSQGATAG